MSWYRYCSVSVSGEKWIRRLPLTEPSSCGGPQNRAQVAMISTIVSCLENEHRKLDELILQLSQAATRLASNPSEISAKARAIDAWDAIRQELWSHLQIEDSLVFSWGNAHRAISPIVLESLRVERREIRKLLAALPDLPSGQDGGAQAIGDGAGFARTLMALAQNLDSHVAGYDAAVLPAILQSALQQ
jgi:iron-sulfur cluster repair protein YtfE (RIC family)